MTIGIPYKSNKSGLSALLCMLQPQLKSSDSIYVIDNSPDKSGLAIAQLYGSSRLPIVVETGNYTIYQSWNIAIEFMLDNVDSEVVLFNDDVVVSQTFVTNLRRALTETEYLAIVPTTPDRTHVSRRLDPNFNWFNKISGKVVATDWMSGFAFCLKKEAIQLVGKFDEEFQIWFGDTEYNDRLAGKIGRMTEEYVYHFGSSSFSYASPEVQKVVQKDREHYVQLSGKAPSGTSGVSEDNPRKAGKD